MPALAAIYSRGMPQGQGPPSVPSLMQSSVGGHAGSGPTLAAGGTFNPAGTLNPNYFQGGGGMSIGNFMRYGAPQPYGFGVGGMGASGPGASYSGHFTSGRPLPGQ